MARSSSWPRPVVGSGKSSKEMSSGVSSAAHQDRMSEVLGRARHSLRAALAWCVLLLLLLLRPTRKKAAQALVERLGAGRAVTPPAQKTRREEAIVADVLQIVILGHLQGGLSGSTSFATSTRRFYGWFVTD